MSDLGRSRPPGNGSLSPLRRRTAKRWRTWPLVGLLACAALMPQQTADAQGIEDLVTWMTGSFSSARQSASDSAYFDIRLHVVPVWPERTDGRWMYVEQAAAASLDRPYRQRVYRVTESPDGVYRSEVFLIPQAPRFAGAWRNEAPLSTLAPDSLEPRTGCAVVLRRVDAGFRGGTEGAECESSLGGAAYATSQVTINDRGMQTWDRGFDANGVQVWGAEKGPYVFDRLLSRSDLGMADLLAWCIVPFDSVRRGPDERLTMLEELGFSRYAYDWRTEHLATAADEFRMAGERGIEVAAVWMWIDGGADRPGSLSAANETILDAVAQSGLSTQLWVGVNANYFAGADDGESLERAVELIAYLDERASGVGAKVALYNHGDWFGEPENQVRIIERLPGREIGIVYNFHHGHAHVERFDRLVESMLPYLWVVNLNGMAPEGPKILPIGHGSHEWVMLDRILDAGFRGPFGILGHVEDEDVAVVLRRNLSGLGLR